MNDSKRRNKWEEELTKQFVNEAKAFANIMSDNMRSSYIFEYKKIGAYHR